MCETLGVLRYEYRMQIRRAGLWISLALFTGLFSWELLLRRPDQIPPAVLHDSWRLAGFLTVPLSVLAPVVEGILVADRFPQDQQIRLREILRASLPSSWPLVVGRCLGSLLAVLTPPTILLVAAVLLIATRLEQPAVYWQLLVALLLLIFPSWLFIVAWSLALPLVLPLRLYQVLYGGFWLWATRVPPGILPTIHQSILDVSGTYALHTFFHEEGGNILY